MAINWLLSGAALAGSIVTAPRLLFGFAVAAAVTAPLEVLLPLHGGRRTLRSMATDLTHAIGNRSMILPLVALLLAGVGPVAAWLVPPVVRHTLAGAGAGVVFAVVFTSSDLCNYLGHRALHRLGMLWRFHAIHHSSERVDWLATSRGHPIDQALNIAAASIPLYAFGAPRYAPTLVVFLYLYPFLLHADARIAPTWLDWVLVTPRFHHWHHAAAERAHNRNFGTVLSVWDHLFGTAVRAQDFPDQYGIADPGLDADDYVGHLVAPFRRRRHPDPDVPSMPRPVLEGA